MQVNQYLRKKAVKAFCRFGYTHVHSSGDQAILQKSQSPWLSVPLHKEISPFLLKVRIKKASIPLNDSIEALK